MKEQILVDSQDSSVNLISPVIAGDRFETRAVFRDSTCIIYLSSATGCNLSCRFCWLTQTNQTSMNYATVDDYLNKTKEILDYLSLSKSLEGIDTLHFNFMARGDVLSNHYFTEQFPDIFKNLTKLAQRYIPRIKPKFKLSTIFPNDIQFDHDYEFDTYDVRTWIVDRILNYASDHQYDVEFYYSLYSLRSEFRKKWIPKAIDPEWIGQAFSGRDSGLRLHHALIEGQNDTEEDVALIHEWLERHDLHVKLNIVHYNPFNDKCGEESSCGKLDEYLLKMRESHRILDTQIVSRASTEVYAACGMFIS